MLLNVKRFLSRLSERYLTRPDAPRAAWFLVDISTMLYVARRGLDVLWACKGGNEVTSPQARQSHLSNVTLPLPPCPKKNLVNCISNLGLLSHGTNASIPCLACVWVSRWGVFLAEVSKILKVFSISNKILQVCGLLSGVAIQTLAHLTKGAALCSHMQSTYDDFVCKG